MSNNLPPGVTSAMIEQQMVGDCGAYSPDGRFTCNIRCDGAHDGDHEHEAVAAHWRFATASDAAKLNGVTVGNLIDASILRPQHHSCVIARWPQRDDDFLGDGSPRPRGDAR